MKKAVILLSGGLDSSTCLAFAKAAGFSCHALSFNYHQKTSQAELAAARSVADYFGVCQTIFDLPIGQWGKSALTDATIAVPDYSGSNEIPTTYVPARNTIFLATALGFAETLGAQDIFIGVSAVDYSGYPDCRPVYIQAFQTMANLATKNGIENNNIVIHTPLIHLSKAQTILLGTQLGVDYRLTLTCYRASPAGEACGECDSCVLRKRGFAGAAIADPTLYAEKQSILI